MQTARKVNKKIYLYQTIIPHYRIPIWKRLNHSLGGNLVVIYGKQPRYASHFIKNSFPFPTCKVRNYWIADNRLWIQSFYKPFKEFGKPEVVISSQTPRCLSLFPLIAICRRLKIPLVLRGHGGSRRRNILTSNHPVDRIHRWLIQNCDAYICYTDQSRDVLSRITDPSKLFVARNTLDTNVLFALRRKLEIQGKERIRHEIGLTESINYVCFIGRLLKTKQVDLMLRSLHLLQKSNKRIGAVIIGDGPERHNLENLSRKLNLFDIHFTGFLSEWHLSAPYLYACDVVVNPGDVGLSVNHALSFGLPVITQKPGQNGPFHGPEVAFIKHGITGFFANNSDIHDIAEKILDVLNQKRRMSRECRMYAEKYLTIENMVEGHIKAIKFVKHGL